MQILRTKSRLTGFKKKKKKTTLQGQGQQSAIIKPSGDFEFQNFQNFTQELQNYCSKTLFLIKSIRFFLLITLYLHDKCKCRLTRTELFNSLHISLGSRQNQHSTFLMTLQSRGRPDTYLNPAHLQGTLRSLHLVDSVGSLRPHILSPLLY